MTLKCVLFDLDGTLLDTSYDFCHALNLTCQEFGVSPPGYAEVRNTVSQGGAALTRLAFPNASESEFDVIRRRFLTIYRENIALHTRVFPGLESGMQHLAERSIPWGIVTNKPSDLTHHLLSFVTFPSSPKSIVCGDTLSVRKPNPEPMWLAAEQCKSKPAECLYLGDHPRDIEAGILAGMPTGAALFGYLPENKIENLPQANYGFRTPYEISQFLMETF
jgi:phosphoglycolate phosphatase